MPTPPARRPATRRPPSAPRRLGHQARPLVALATVAGALSMAAAAVTGPGAGVLVTAAGGADSDEAAAAATVGAAPGRSADVATRYRVRAGDTVASVAFLHAVAPDALVAANDLRPPYELSEGDVVSVPWRQHPSPLPRAADHHPRADALSKVFARWADANDVPVDLLMAVAWRESRWKADAVSADGAVGIAQLLPTTATWVAEDLLGEDSLDPNDIDDNVRMSARFLRWLLDRADGDQAAALASYYQGPASTSADGWYRVTEAYVHDVFALRWAFHAAR